MTQAKETLRTKLLLAVENALENKGSLSGFLFHGTCEDIEGNLRGGDYDGVLWTSSHPAIAQQYIPASGSQTLLSMPYKYDMETQVKPNDHSPWTGIAQAISGISLDAFDREFDRSGRLTSWRHVENWPTYEACVAYLQNDLGYDLENQPWVKCGLVEGKTVFLPSDYLMPGRLFVTSNESLRFKDLRVSSEGDLMNWNTTIIAASNWQLTKVRRIIINDFAQTTHYGNLGHVSYGLLPSALDKVEWIEIPATRFEANDIDDFGAITPDLKTWYASACEEDLTQSFLP